MKRTASFLLTAILVLGLFAGCGEKKKNIYGEALAYPQGSLYISSGNNGTFSYDVYEDYIKITGHNDSQAETVSFPAEVEGKPVKVIGRAVLQGNRYVESVTVPDSVEIIENYAFEECKALTDIKLSDNLKKVGSSVFYGTPWADSKKEEFVTVGKGVLIKYNGDDDEIVIPDYVGYVSDAFRCNEMIVSVEIPSSVKGISDYAFYDCGSLGEVAISQSIADIGSEAFKGTTWIALEKSEFLTVGDGVLIDYKGLNESVVVPDTVKYISGAFNEKTNVKSVTVPRSVRFVRYGTFSGCEQLEKVEFSGIQTKIDENLFSGCDKLESVVLPGGLQYIPAGLFTECQSLVTAEIPQGVKTIGNMAFYYCDKLAEMTLPEGVEYLGTGAFFGCSKLKKVTLPDSVESIKKSGFGCCFELEPFAVPPKVTVIEGGVFSYCHKFSEFVVPEQVTAIEECAFEGIQDIKLTVKNKATELQNLCFGENTDRVTIKCQEGSKAQQFADSNKIKCVTEG